MDLLPALLPLLCLLLSLACLYLYLRPGWRSRLRNRRAERGESAAEQILEEAGYEVVERQARAWSSLWVDGEELDFELRVDLIAERDGQRFVVEVKTGELAPDPLHGPTRRQLREYAAVFEDHGLLLLDMEQQRLVEVRFP
jgi:Holliday junction resolvase-like predicted endonuclease